MGTKNNPGEFDCYAAAKPDEPMFVLLARDDLAPLMVELWAFFKQQRHNGEHTLKIKEALQCAQSMKDWRAKQKKADQ